MDMFQFNFECMRLVYWKVHQNQISSHQGSILIKNFSISDPSLNIHNNLELIDTKARKINGFRAPR